MSSACTHRGGSVLTGAGSPRALPAPRGARPASLGDARNPAPCFGHRVQLMHEHAERLGSLLEAAQLFPVCSKKRKKKYLLFNSGLRQEIIIPRAPSPH